MPRKSSLYQSGKSVQKLFHRLPHPVIDQLGREVSQKARQSGLTYTDEHGKTALITLTLRPRLIPLERRNALWRTLRILDGAFQKIASLYFKIPLLEDLFPFSSREREWLEILREPGYRPGRIASRWDANTTFSDRDWKEGSSFFEVNGVGVGGIWYGPASAEVALKTVVPKLHEIDPGFRVFPNHDMRLLLLYLLLAQRKKIGRTRGVMALAMEKASGSNFIEFVCLAKLFTQMGYPSIVAEPTDFRLKGEELFARGKKIDILYRDTTLSELCLLEEKGHDLRALQTAFKRGQVISSLEGEFDHKSVFEVFTDPEYASFFTPRERRLFKRHILWTRLLREIKTTDPQERPVDLIPYVLRHQSELVLKPNRLYGGKGVLLGREASRSVWHKKIDAGLKEEGGWVIQRLGKLRAKRFFRHDGQRAREKDLYVVSGFLATEKGLGIVGRMSERTVVNVARRGGLTPILLVKN